MRSMWGKVRGLTSWQESSLSLAIIIIWCYDNRMDNFNCNIEGAMPDNNTPEKYRNSKEACLFLAQQWGMEYYSEDSFRALCFRRKIKADLGEGREAKFYKESTLRNIPKPSKSNPRLKRKKKEKGPDTDSEQEETTMVLLHRGGRGGEAPLVVAC